MTQYLINSIKGGLERIKRENPEADFAYETTETKSAEKVFDVICGLHLEGGCDMERVAQAFKKWEQAFLMQFQEPTLF